ncbi:MAG: large conductance mechanosensitive channel protein MscL [Bacteroidota bacterium]|jgi:large conductance mechanosensitive channel|uniref:large conductance mechanosensitive channel protein MscL n=1 Tax=Flavobacterium sp. TaxID=239 RepID=UPI00323D0BA1
MLKEFKNFIMTGNVVEFAVAVIMAGAIGAVVIGFVGDIIMPVVGHFSGGMDFSSMAYTLDEASKKADGTVIPANVIALGKWINTIISLLVVGFVMFLIVKSYNKMKKPEVAAAAGPSQEELLTQIRDLLKK